ncbi:MAG: hypothetical protein KME55_40650 [Nostoc indistinguendum CM1-VF10]|jgi:Ca2+-binding RTX toxin-like protein|nr:hypothetical protein [Nostoc indistinguendum CM1-VF10]
MANIIGTKGNDTLLGSNNTDTIKGLAGNDTITGNEFTQVKFAQLSAGLSVSKNNFVVV